MENIKIIENCIGALNNENHVEQQSPGKYDLMNDIDVYMENYRKNPHDSPSD